MAFLTKDKDKGDNQRTGVITTASYILSGLR